MPQSPLLPKAAAVADAQPHNGYWWDSTEQTAMVLFGLVDYLADSQELNADFNADVRVNGSSVSHRHFTPADAPRWNHPQCHYPCRFYYHPQHD